MAVVGVTSAAGWTCGEADWRAASAVQLADCRQLHAPQLSLLGSLRLLPIQAGVALALCLLHGPIVLQPTIQALAVVLRPLPRLWLLAAARRQGGT